MRGGLGGNKEFDGAEIEARSAGSQWVSLLVEGTLGRNNALRLADAKQASALRVSVICYFISEQPCGSPRPCICDSHTIDASTGQRSCQVRGLLFHLDVLGKPGSSAASAEAGGCTAVALRGRALVAQHWR